MKLEWLEAEKSVPMLWEFFRDNLPPSLRAAKRGDGYGTVYGIEVKYRTIGSYFVDGIATVGDDTLELRHPEYFSDFEELCRRYESATGREVTFRCWQS